MDDSFQERRGLFDGLKVPALDVSAIILALVAILLFQLGVSVISAVGSAEVSTEAVEATQTIDLTRTIAGNVLGRFGATGKLIADAFGLDTEHKRLALGYYLGFFGWGLVIWAFFSLALQRVAAMRLAREEGLSIAEALKFAASKFTSNLLTVAAVVAFTAVLYLLFNASIAGWLSRVPYLGDLLFPLLFLLVLLSSFLMVFCIALGIFGFNLASAAIATESSDFFDGISRSWNYILSRPWVFLSSNALIILYIVLFVTFGSFFVKLSATSLSVGDYGLGRDVIAVDASPEMAKLLKLDDEQTRAFAELDAVQIPGKADYVYRRYVQRLDDASGERYLQTQENGQAYNVLPLLKREYGLFYYSAGLVGIFISVCQLLVYAYAVNYFMAGQSTIYFLTRKEVDGDDYNEIIIGEDDDEDGFEFRTYAQPPASPPPAGPDDKGGSGDKGQGDNKDGGDGKSLPMVMEV